MSMKLMQQLQEDHSDLQNLKNRKERNYDKRFSKLEEEIINLKEEMINKLNSIVKLLNRKTTETYIYREDKPKINGIEEDVNTFIPDIDTSDMSINSKEEEENLKDLSLEGGLDALDVLINKK